MYPCGVRSSIFGGLLDRCTISPFDVVYIKNKYVIVTDGFTHFKSISSIDNSSTVASHAVRIYFCRDGQPTDGLQLMHIQAKKGELFTVPLVAVDQVNRTINATIRSSLSSTLGGLDEDQSTQNTSESCTDLQFRVFSPHHFEHLTLYADGPCKDAELSKGRISIQFLPCTCPIGFQPNETTKCGCLFDSKLNKFITKCHQENRTLEREGTFWITHIDSTDNSSGYNYLIYPHCPLNYCHPPTTKVYINLSMELGSDAQCNFNRSGILCGRCQTSLSLSLGSSRCIQCSNKWPAMCIVLIIAFFLGGISLVTILLVLNLTVAMGTLNGIIFYANIINANTSTFFPFKATNLITVFIAWLNLELGIDTCLFKGLDTYWKTLLQFAFPIYVILLVIMVIVISERSTRFARLIGRKNPVATLDTLILLSYAKLINTIIASLSLAILDYPDGSHQVVWLPDGTVGYLSGKHILLFFTAVLILIVGVAYTALLFSWQWLILYQHKKVFRWVRYHRFYLFLEPYHAPYDFKHRYWTGLLLLVRVVLYIASALNVNRAPGIDLLITGVVMIGLSLFKGHVGINGCIYRKWPLDVLEITCYINLTVLSFAGLYTLEAQQDQRVVGYISGTITFALFLIVLIYHMFTETCFKKTKIANKLKWIRGERHVDEDEDPVDYQLADNDLSVPCQPTVTWVDPPSHKEQTLSSPVDLHKIVREDNNKTPLLGKDEDFMD